MAKKEFKGLGDWSVLLDVENAGPQVSIYEYATSDGETDVNWIVVDKGEQLDWLIEELTKIKEEK